MTADAEKSPLDVSIAGRALPDEVNAARRAHESDNAANQEVAKPRIEAQLMACRIVSEQLKEWHRQIADTTDLELTGYSRASALWLLSGRCLGLLEALLVLAEAGIDAETMVTGRALHEANRILMVFSDPDEEELLRLWLDDEGKHGYVKPGAARGAQARFEEKLDEAMRRHNMTPIGRTSDLSAEVHDRMSRVAHSRRSTCVSSVWEMGREMAYGRHPSPLRRAPVVEWASAMTVEVANAAGDALRAFYGQEFFSEEVVPLIRSIEAVRATAPLDESSIRSEAGT